MYKSVPVCRMALSLASSEVSCQECHSLQEAHRQSLSRTPRVRGNSPESLPWESRARTEAAVVGRAPVTCAVPLGTRSSLWGRRARKERRDRRGGEKDGKDIS